MHLTPTKGNKQQADDYINKRGKWEEKGEQVVLIKYHGEPILFMDELRSDSLSYTLLLTMTEGYKSQLHSRYTNTYCLWNEIHITSIFPPDVMYKQMYLYKHDTYEQLKRRITYIVYHFKEKGKFLTKKMSMAEYEKNNNFIIDNKTDENFRGEEYEET